MSNDEIYPTKEVTQEDIERFRTLLGNERQDTIEIMLDAYRWYIDCCYDGSPDPDEFKMVREQCIRLAGLHTEPTPTQDEWFEKKMRDRDF